MGRTRVDPSKRRRAMQACAPCHASKKRCDSKEPCTNCLKRNEASSCIYDLDRPRVPGNIQSTNTKEVSSKATAERPADHEADGSRMLWNLRGSQVYVGRSASLSYLHVLRNIFLCYMGHSPFTDDNRRSMMLEAEYSPGNFEGVQCEHLLFESCALVDHFLAATCGILDVLSKEQIMRAIQQPSLVHSPLRDTTIHIILAIGAQCRANGPQDKFCEKYHISQVHKGALETMLEDPNVHMIRVFLLLGFYMLGACRRNCAFMYVGVAARAAHAIGLHHEESYRSVSQEDKEAFANTWRSVRLLDLVMCSVLGRPTATSHVEKSLKSNGARIPEAAFSHRHLALQACSEAWYFVDQIVQLFYKPEMADFASAKALLAKLEAWSEGLADSLKTYTPSGSTIQDRETIIGNMNVSCSYYFAMLLLSRKYFVSHQMFRLAQKYSKTKIKDQIGPSEYPDMAQTCVDSAKLLLQMCRDVMNINMLLNNMCLLKAWIFAAALVIGLAMFADDTVQPDLADAFDAATAVLNKFSPYSPQAQHYYEILTSLFKAVQDHHQRYGTRGAQGEKRVGKIFDLRAARSVQPLQTQSLLPALNNNRGQSSMLPGEWPSMPSEADFLSPISQSIAMDQMAETDMDIVAAQLWNDLISQGFPFSSGDEMPA